jgi:hypothetical protein
MKAIDNAINDRIEKITALQTEIDAINTNSATIENIAAVFPDPTVMFGITISYAGTVSLHVHQTVHNLAEDVAGFISELEAHGFKLEEWYSQDSYEARRRTYIHAGNGPCNLWLNALLADDATCRLEIIGYEETEVWETVKVTRSLPITKLVCGEADHE